ncbi:MAG TPA: hypothetical protein PLB62_13605 [Candidatus Sumerlaeota bacterium]|nr:hypothetical protein [Candidatus Sumerlaeota bacterium]
MTAMSLASIAKYLTALAALVLAIFVPGHLHADRIILKNGRDIEGRITTRSEERLTIETPRGIFNLRTDEIGQIRNEPEAVNCLWDSRTALEMGDLDSALHAWMRAKALGIPREILNIHIIETRERLAGLFRNATCSAQHRAAEKILDLIGTVSPPSENDKVTSGSTNVALWIAAFFMRADFLSEAATVYRGLPRPLPPHDPKFSRDFHGALQARAINDLQAGRMDEAVQYLDILEDMNVEDDPSNRLLLYLRWGAGLRDQGQWADAAKIYAEKMAAVSPPLARNRLESLIRSMIEQAGADSECSLAVELSDLYRELLDDDTRTALAVAAHRKALLMVLEQGDVAPALERLEMITKMTGNPEPFLLALCEYTSRSLVLTDSDTIGHLKLALFCRRNELPDQARRHLEIASRDERLRDMVEAEDALLKAAGRIRTLQESIALYERGDYYSSLDKLQTLFDDRSSTSALDEASRLAGLCRTELEEESARRPMRALVLFQQAERFYLSQEYDSAMIRLDYLLEVYPDAPIASKAREMLLGILRRRDLEKVRNSMRMETFKQGGKDQER